jgi:hypothetical protein
MLMSELYPHQRKAIDELKTGSILCGGVGSGKSMTSIAYYFEKECGGYFDKENYKPMTNEKMLYIITTARKRDTFEWERECSRFSITNEVVDSWNNIEKYKDVRDAFFIFDEQRVVGSGKWVRNFIKIAQNNNWILLSATPGDTWMDYIPVFIANGFYKNRTEFIREHVVYNSYMKFPKVDHYINVGKLIRLRNQIVVVMDYKKPTDAHDETILCGYDKDLYKMIFKRRWNPYEDVPISNISELCYLLRKVSNSSVDRILAIENLLIDHPKVIIFYNFDYELETLRSLGNGRTKVAEWNGHKHEPIPKSDEWVYLVQYSAGAEGWNCIETDTIIFFSQNYSYKTMIQAAGRIDRMNTPFTDLYYYHLRSNSPIDLGIENAIEQKQAFNETMFINKMGG